MGLVLENITKFYGAVKAVEHADLSIDNGEVRAILGGNGSGKSTLAKVISGLAGKNSGKILLNGTEINFQSPAEAKKQHVIMTSQELSLFNNLTVEENISICNMPVRWKFTDEGKVKERARGVLQELHLEDLMGRKVSELAPNQQYMIEFAKALVQEPKVLLVDEITSALYREDVKIVTEVIKKLKKKGTIIRFISHRMEELYTICDSVTIMRNGVTYGTYPMNDKTEDELLSLMIGSKIESFHGSARKSDKERTVLLDIPEIPIPSYGTSIHLQVGKGEIIGIAGLQGHGQVDLINSIYGLNGSISVRLEGKELKIDNPRQAVRDGFAYISGDREKDGTFKERSIAENLTAVYELVKRKKGMDVPKTLSKFFVKYDSDKALITSLSGGNQQKVVVGRWLAANPKVLLANDPTKGIDVKAREDLHRLFTELVKAGNAVIMVSSDEDELVNITAMPEFSRVLVMYEGNISAELEGDEITRENISSASMPVQRRA